VVVLPFDDLGDEVPPLLVVGRETALATGDADVVAVDRDGLVTVIETKLGRNPEVKRTVAAQALGYAASLWGLSYDDFDRDVAQRYFSGGQCPEPDLNGLALDEAMARFVEARALGGDWDRLRRPRPAPGSAGRAQRPARHRPAARCLQQAPELPAVGPALRRDPARLSDGHGGGGWPVAGEVKPKAGTYLV
jgi:hypothetical protein